MWILILAFMVVLAVLVVAAAIVSANDERRFEEIMSRWGVDVAQIDTEEYEDAIAAVEDALSSFRAVNEDIEALSKIGINLNTFCVGGADDTIQELEQIKDQIESAEEKYIDSFRADNRDFM